MSLGRILAALTLAALAAGCGEKVDRQAAPPVAPAAVSYATQIAPIVAACVPCHSGARPNGGVELSSYDTVKRNAARANASIQSGRMPPGGGMSASARALFQAWVDQGSQP